MPLTSVRVAPSGERLRRKGRHGVFSGKTVWSMPERFKIYIAYKRRYINTLAFLLYNVSWQISWSTPFVQQTDAILGPPPDRCAHLRLQSRRPNYILFCLAYRWIARRILDTSFSSPDLTRALRKWKGIHIKLKVESTSDGTQDIKQHRNCLSASLSASQSMRHSACLKKMPLYFPLALWNTDRLSFATVSYLSTS